MNKRPNILVLEDDPSMRGTYCKIFESFGNVLAAANSEEMYKQVRDSEDIALFVLDIRIKIDDRYPIKTAGLDVLSAVRRLYSTDVPVIMISGYEVSKEKLELAKHLNAYYLKKPFKLDELERLTGRLLEEYSGRQGAGIECYANAYFADGTPAPLIAEETYSLYVQVTPQPLTRAVSGALRFRKLSDVDLQVVVSAEEMDVSPSARHLSVNANGMSEPIEFLLTPKPSSIFDEKRKIHVCFFYGASLLKTISFDIGVFTPRNGVSLPPSGSAGDPGAPFSIPSSHQLSVFSLTFLQNNTGIVGIFMRGSALYPSALSVPDKDGWEELNETLRGALRKISVDACDTINVQKKPLSKEQSERFLAPLLEAGERVFYKLFPNRETRDRICQIIDDAVDEAMNFNTAPIIEIASDSYLIPWDLVQFCVSEDSTEFDLSYENMWGMKCIVYKKCSTNTPVRQDKPIMNHLDELKVGIPWNSAFNTVRKFELNYLKRFPGQVSVIDLDSPSQVDEILNLLKQKSDILQFACHGCIEIPKSNSHFRFSDSVQLTLGQLQNPRVTIDTALVILSSCDSLHFDARQRDSFLSTFMNKGARGVLGTEVKVNAPFASRFITDIYQRFLTGKPIGLCLLEARQKCWNNPSCLAPFGAIFSFYGDIWMHVEKPIPGEIEGFPCAEMNCCYE